MHHGQCYPYCFNVDEFTAVHNVVKRALRVKVSIQSALQFVPFNQLSLSLHVPTKVSQSPRGTESLTLAGSFNEGASLRRVQKSH